MKKKNRLSGNTLKSMLNIIESTKLTKEERRRKLYIKLSKHKVVLICNQVYGFSLLNEKKWFRDIAYESFGLGYALRDMGDFHILAITKCKIKDTNWRNYLTNDGKVIEGK